MARHFNRPYIKRLIGTHTNGSVPFLTIAMQDGMMGGQGFMQRLRALTPLQRQATPPPQMQLVESEDEDEELGDGRREEEGRYFDHEEQDEYEDDDHSSHRTSAAVPGQAGLRKYALYQADEESDDDYDDRETRRPVTKSHRSSNSGASDPRGRQDQPRGDGYPRGRLGSSHDDGYHDQPHIPVAQGYAQRYTETARKVQEEVAREASDPYDHVSDDEDERGLEDLLSAHRENPSTPPPPPPVVQRTSRSNSGMQRSKFDVELDGAAPSEQTRTAHAHAHLPEIVLDRNANSWKQSLDDVLKEGQLEHELEVEEEVVWEVGEESEADAHVDAHAELDRQPDENSDEIRKADNRNGSSSMKEEDMDMIELDPSIQQQQHQQHQQQLLQEVGRERTNTPSQGLYESQRIEDLDVVGLSQWASPPQHLHSKENLADTTPVGVVVSGLVDGTDVADAAGNMRPMATASHLQKEEQEEDKTLIVGESQGGGGELMMEGEEDDISCLDVEGFDY